MPSAEYKKEWRLKNPEKVKEHQKRHRAKPEYKAIRDAQNHKWYKDHTEECKVISRQYYKDNKDAILEGKKVYQIENREQIQKTKRIHYLKNRDRIRKTNAEYGKSPAGRRAAKASYAKRRSAEGSFTAEDIKDLYATQGGRCYYCSVDIENNFHIEHMTPLSRGGRNDVSNICLACAPCNLRKHTKTAEEFIGESHV